MKEGLNMEKLNFIFRTIKQKPLRFLLTALQISLGVLAATLIFNIYFGFNKLTQRSAQSLGKELLKVEIYSEFVYDNGVGRSMGNHFLSAESMQELIENSPDIVSATPINSSFTMLVVDNMLYRAMGTYEAGAAFGKTIPLDFIVGSFYTETEEDECKTVISENMALSLFGTTDVLGKTIGAKPFKEAPTTFYLITGVFKQPPLVINTMIENMHMIYTPKYPSSNRFINFIVRTTPEGQQKAIEDLKDLVFKECGPEAIADIKNASESLNEIRQFTDIFLKILGVLAFFAVVVSSIGILSIMLVNILERTREIGIRRSLGTSQRAVFFQILIESMVLSLGGGILGVILAFIITCLFNVSNIFAVFNEIFALPNLGFNIEAVLVSLALSCVVGGLFGIYPAYQAAKLPPIEALQE